jgi:hypothetical protein
VEFILLIVIFTLTGLTYPTFIAAYDKLNWALTNSYLTNKYDENTNNIVIKPSLQQINYTMQVVCVEEGGYTVNSSEIYLRSVAGILLNDNVQCWNITLLPQATPPSEPSVVVSSGPGLSYNVAWNSTAGSFEISYYLFQLFTQSNNYLWLNETMDNTSITVDLPGPYVIYGFAITVYDTEGFSNVTVVTQQSSNNVSKYCSPHLKNMRFTYGNCYI